MTPDIDTLREIDAHLVLHRRNAQDWVGRNRGDGFPEAAESYERIVAKYDHWLVALRAITDHTP